MNSSSQLSWSRSKLPGPCLIRVRSLAGRAMSGNRPPEALLNHRAEHCASLMVGSWVAVSSVNGHLWVAVVVGFIIVEDRDR